MLRLKSGAPIPAAVVSCRRKVLPYARLRRESGKRVRTRVERADGTTVDLHSRDEIGMTPGDVFVIQPPSGGVYGLPQTSRETAACPADTWAASVPPAGC